MWLNGWTLLWLLTKINTDPREDITSGTVINIRPLSNTGTEINIRPLSNTGTEINIRPLSNNGTKTAP